MRPTFRLCLAAALSPSRLQPALAAEPPKRTLARFESEAELKDWLDQLKKRAEPPARAKGALGMADSAVMARAHPLRLRPPPAAAEKKAEDAITNVQTAGVDEGGIVKVHGDHLVVLRRGRLFTVSIRGTELASVSMADAFGAGIDPRGAWYDEMLIRGDTIIVIGFSYQRGGTEVGLFDIDRGGALSHRATYHLRSNDYYSVPQLREPPHRRQADLLYAALSQPPSAIRSHRCRRCAAGTPMRRRRNSGASRPPRASIAPTSPVEPWGLTLHTVTGLRPGEARHGLRVHRRHGTGRARVLRVAGLGLRLDHPASRRAARVPPSSASRSKAAARPRR
jgi:hypothetical protein